MKVGGNWPITNSDLANKHIKCFQKFVNTINLETLSTEKKNNIFRGTKLTLGHFVKGILTTKLDSAQFLVRLPSFCVT
jgi:hypothetical protein